MALLPIDLQTLFTQSAQVGKEQAVQKDAPPTAQSAQGALLVQRAQTRDNSVNETHNQEEGPEQVKEKARRGGERQERQPRKRRASTSPGPSKNVVKDPALGRNIDVTG